MDWIHRQVNGKNGKYGKYGNYGINRNIPMLPILPIFPITHVTPTCFYDTLKDLMVNPGVLKIIKER